MNGTTSPISVYVFVFNIHPIVYVIVAWLTIKHGNLKIQSSLFGDLTGHNIEDGEVNPFMDFHVTFHEGRTCGNTPRRFMMLEPTCR